MGADLYITEINDRMVQKYGPRFEAAVKKRDLLPRDSKAWQRADAEVGKYFDRMYGEGYFRDSYNATNLLWTLQLSWWRDVIPRLTADRKLSGDNLKQFRRLAADAKQHLPSKQQLRDNGVQVEDTGEDRLEEWHRYYREKREELIKFLDQAIALNTAVHCSL
jgi:hypothetical protein